MTAAAACIGLWIVTAGQPSGAAGSAVPTEPGIHEASMNWAGVCELLDCNPRPHDAAVERPTAVIDNPVADELVSPPTTADPCPTLSSCGPYKVDKPRDVRPRDEIGTGSPGVVINGPNPHSQADYIGDPVVTPEPKSTPDTEPTPDPQQP